ncbi:MAG: hypothetical protein R3C15_10045 [Thermoleophilia bacterium]
MSEGAVEDAASAMVADGSENVGKIRDILFGAQMRDYEDRFARLEERLADELAALRSEQQDRLSATELALRSELDGLAARLGEEREERVDGLKRAAAELKETAKAIDRRLAALDQAGGATASDLGALRTEVGQRLDALDGRLAAEADALRTSMTDRAALAGLLEEVGARLREAQP